MSDMDFRVMLEKMDLGEIERLKLAKEAVTWLEGRRQALQAEIGAVNEQIAGVKEGRLDPGTVLPKSAPRQSGTATGVAMALRRRAARTGTLRDKVVEVLRTKGSEMGIEDIAKAVQDAGYETMGKNFRQQVTVVLGNSEEIERVRRGEYRLKAGR